MGAVRQASAYNLAYHRARRGLTQADLAEIVGTSPSYIGHLERAEREPSLLTIEELCRALQIQAGELLVARRPDGGHPSLDELQEILRGRGKDDLQMVIRLVRTVLEHPKLAIPAQAPTATRHRAGSSSRRRRADHHRCQ